MELWLRFFFALSVCQRQPQERHRSHHSNSAGLRKTHICRCSKALVGWRPSLLGWSPLLLGWRPSPLGCRPYAAKACRFSLCQVVQDFFRPRTSAPGTFSVYNNGIFQCQGETTRGTNKWAVTCVDSVSWMTSITKDPKHAWVVIDIHIHCLQQEYVLPTRFNRGLNTPFPRIIDVPCLLFVC